MADDDELRAIGHRAHHIVEPAHVRFVQRRVDLVQNAEWRRLDQENREQQRNRRQRLLAARKQLDVLHDLLARRIGDDIDPRLQQIPFVGQAQMRAPAAEHSRIDLAKLRVNGVECLRIHRYLLPPG